MLSKINIGEALRSSLQGDSDVEWLMRINFFRVDTELVLYQTQEPKYVKGGGARQGKAISVA